MHRTRALIAATFVAALAATAAAAAVAVVVRVRGNSSALISTDCFLRLRQHVVGGGSVTYCLKVFHGEPGARATVRDSGVMTFMLPGGTLRASVQIVERFAADGAEAKQTLQGMLTGGSGRYARGRGTIKGGGSVVERPPGHIVQSNLRYVLLLR